MQSTTFVTGSRYNGTFCDNEKLMSGFGVYTFPNGSEYRGFFKNGLFHGFGRFILRNPSIYTFTGIFWRGRLVKLDGLKFADNLNFKCALGTNKIDIHKWFYCTVKDRRFWEETTKGLEAVGPDAYQTPHHPPKVLTAGQYDAIEGIFKEKIGFIVKRPLSFNDTRFVSCPDEIEMIKTHFRHAPLTSKEKLKRPDADLCKYILQNNISEMNNPYININRKCPRIDGHPNFYEVSSNDSCKSFETESLNFDLNEFITEEIKRPTIFEPTPVNVFGLEAKKHLIFSHK